MINQKPFIGDPIESPDGQLLEVGYVYPSDQQPQKDAGIYRVDDQYYESRTVKQNKFNEWSIV